MDADYLAEQNAFQGSCFLTFSLIGRDVFERANSRRCQKKSNDMLKEMLCVKVRGNVGNWRQCAEER